MKERELRAELRRMRPADAEQAHERARAVVLGVYDGRRPLSRRRRRAAVPVAMAFVFALAGGVFAATAPGAAVSDWVRDLVGRERPAPRPAPALAGLPAAGRLLVSGPGGAWIVDADGSRRRLGAYREVTWSPQGLFVAVTRDRQLLAVDRRGSVRWALARRRPVHDPRWAPSGYRIAYRSGDSLRVVAADGSGDRLIASRVRPVAAAWRPGPRNDLAYVDRSGRVVFTDVDASRTLRRSRPGSTVQALQWSADGTRLLLTSARGIQTLDTAGTLRTIYRGPPGSSLVDAQFAPIGSRVAVVRRRGRAGHEVLVTTAAARRPKPRSLFSAAAPIRSVTWSPGGRLILADWTGADQWLFLPVRPSRQASAVAGIAGHFDPSRRRARSGLRIEGWCCP